MNVLSYSIEAWDGMVEMDGFGLWIITGTEYDGPILEYEYV